MVLLALTAMRSNGVTALYIGLTEKAVKYSIVNKLWKPLVRKYKLPFTAVNSDGVATCTTTGSIVRFASCDDQAHIESFLGDSLAGGIVIVDECQSIPLNVLQPLVERIIIPALSDTTEEHPEPGKLRLSGTIPTTPHGYFYHQYVGSNSWAKFRWNRFQNPHLTKQAEALNEVLKLLGLQRNHPMIVRDWDGELVFDANDTAYHYVSQRSTYVPASLDEMKLGPFACTFAPLRDCDRVIVGIDPAQRKDRFALTFFGYNSRTKACLWQLGEAVTEPGADPMESEWLEVLREVKKRYGILTKAIRDPGSSSPVNDTLWHSHGILVESAIKGPGSLKARVDLFADLLARGVCKVIKGGQLDGDLQIAKWDVDEREKGRWAFDKSVCSPDVADSGSYIVPFFTRRGAEEVKVNGNPENDFWGEQQAQWAKEIWQKQVHKPGPKPVSKSMWGPGPR
jgi:hypothetical protein